jgi:hypothetical protein
MPYLTASIPYFKCLVRREYTRNLRDRQGEYIPAIAYGVRCVRGASLSFQCMLREPDDGSPNDTGGASFLVPIEGLCHRPCPVPEGMEHIQPWDTFAEWFGVCAFDLIASGRAYVLPGKVPAQYRFSIDFTGSDLADDPEQHKQLHLCFLESGLIGAFPNNRLLFRDDAFWELMDQPPDFLSLDGEFRAEGKLATSLGRSTTATVPSVAGRPTVAPPDRWAAQANEEEKVVAKSAKHPGFKAVQAKIAKKEGVSKERAGAILANAARNASAGAKRANPRLSRVKG